jgi:hypothetical protein
MDGMVRKMRHSWCIYVDEMEKKETFLVYFYFLFPFIFIIDEHK